MIINYLKKEALDQLTSDIPQNVHLYNSKNMWINQYFEDKGLGSFSFSTGIMVPDVVLTIGDSKTDFENSVKIYDAFKNHINPVQASDLRLWGFLAHGPYWEYMRARWSVEVASEEDEDDENNDKLVSRIGSRYFFKASKGKAFVRQGIARLYWSAYLTYDEDKDNPYEMTEYFLSKQDIFLASAERSLARHKTLLLAALNVLKENGDLKRSDIRNFFVNLNQAGGVIVFDSLSRQDAYDLSKKVLDDTMEGNNKIDYDNKGTEERDKVQFEKNEIRETVVKLGDKIIARKDKTNVRMPIVVGKSIFNTQPVIVGLKVGDKFRIRKNFWVIESIE